MNNTKTLTFGQIRQQLDDWCDLDSPCPSKSEVLEIQGEWNLVKERTLYSYWPIIEDRLAQVQTRLKRGV